jgi:hypothetical protein
MPGWDLSLGRRKGHRTLLTTILLELEKVSWIKINACVEKPSVFYCN